MSNESKCSGWEFAPSRNPIEALHGGFRERGEWGQKVQGAGSMTSKRPGSREQKREQRILGTVSNKFT